MSVIATPPALQPSHHTHTHTSSLLSLWEHTGTQMVKPTLVMSGTSVCLCVCVEGGCGVAADGTEGITNQPTGTHLYEGINGEKTNTKGS